MTHERNVFTFQSVKESCKGSIEPPRTISCCESRGAGNSTTPPGDGTAISSPVIYWYQRVGPAARVLRGRYTRTLVAFSFSTGAMSNASPHKNVVFTA